MRPASPRPSRARRRAFTTVVALVATFGLVTACSDDGPSTPAISGDNPADVTLPTLPPTTTSAPAGDPASDTTSPASETTLPAGEDADADPDATDSSAPTTSTPEGDSDSADTVPDT